MVLLILALVFSAGNVSPRALRGAPGGARAADLAAPPSRPLADASLGLIMIVKSAGTTGDADLSDGALMLSRGARCA
jgi:hypothetical protein